MYAVGAAKADSGSSMARAAKSRLVSRGRIKVVLSSSMRAVVTAPLLLIFTGAACEHTIFLSSINEFRAWAMY